MCTTTEAVTFDLPHSTEAPGKARVLVGSHVCAGHGRDAGTAAELVASELVTCAVLYGQAPLDLTLACEVSHLRLTMRHGVPDGWTGDDLPLDEEGGLRTALLNKLCREWGVDTAGERSRVLWCMLPTGHAPPPRPRTRVLRRRLSS